MAILLLAVSSVAGATTAWFTGQDATPTNRFTVRIPFNESAWGDGVVYQPNNPVKRYFEFTKGELMEPGGQRVDLVQGPDWSKVKLGIVTAWIEEKGGVETLFVKFDTTGYGRMEKTDVYAGLSDAGIPPYAPGEYGSHRTYYGNHVLISLHDDVHRPFFL